MAWTASENCPQIGNLHNKKCSSKKDEKKSNPLAVTIKHDICCCHMLHTETSPLRPLHHNVLSPIQRKTLYYLLFYTHWLFFFFFFISAVIRQNVTLKRKKPTARNEKGIKSAPLTCGHKAFWQELKKQNKKKNSAVSKIVMMFILPKTHNVPLWTLFPTTIPSLSKLHDQRVLLKFMSEPLVLCMAAVPFPSVSLAAVTVNLNSEWGVSQMVSSIA